MTQPSSETKEVEVEVRIAAPPEAVFPFLIDGPKMARWFGSRVELDARAGGRLRVDVNGRDIGAGAFVEIVPNERVVFTFGWEGDGHPVPAGSTTVEIALLPDGDATVVRLRHRDLPAEAADQHREGWAHYLPRLRELAEGRDPGRDPWGAPDAKM